MVGEGSANCCVLGDTIVASMDISKGDELVVFHENGFVVAQG
jgi:hypothetical protein